MFKILSPNLHSCASLALTFFACKKAPTKWYFLPFWGHKRAFFGGGKVRVGGNTPKRVYYHQFGTEFGGKQAQNVRKNGEKRKCGELTYLILGLFGIIWWPDCPQLVPHLI